MCDIKIKLLEILGERLISRSQAKKLLQGFERFTDITLDFGGVEAVGQGFVDEVFRVYQNSRPELSIHFIEANANVAFMIARCIRPIKTTF